MEARRLLPLSGVAFVALVLLPFTLIVSGVPESEASGAELARFYEEDAAREVVATSVFAASIPFLILFAATLAEAFPSRSRTGAIWERMLVAGSVLAGGAVLLTATVRLALLIAAEGELSHGALEALNAVVGNGWVALNGGLGVMMLGAAGLLLGRAGAYQWAGRAALVLGVALFVPYATFFAGLLTGIWIAVMGIALARGRSDPYAIAPDTA